MHAYTGIAIGVALSFLAACKEPVPDWIEEGIRQNPTAYQEVWQFRYRGQTVYYIPPAPYDIPGTLLDKDGKTICSPDGGLTGRGDGKCPDFFDQRHDGTLIWKPEREPQQ